MSPSAPKDQYQAFVSRGFGAELAKRLGLPRPVTLRRYVAGEPLIDGPVVLAEIAEAGGLGRGLADLGVNIVGVDADEPAVAGIVVDASAARAVVELDEVRHALSSVLKRLMPSGRVVVVGLEPGTLNDPEEAATQRALEGIVRSLGKELRRGATANLVQLTTANADPLPAVEFLLSGRSAYVDAQVLRVGETASAAGNIDRDRPLLGKVAMVTGGARGIGAAIVEVLARDGAKVIVVDVPSAGQALVEVANAAGGIAVQVDITSEAAGATLAEAAARLAGLDILVHNAGITRDKLLVNMDASKWAAVLDVNLGAQLRLDRVLLADDGPMKAGGRVISVSSLSGLAGNRGQTNYAASKAGVAGMVTAQAERLAGRGITYNAVAPGFIETEMTAKIPRATREVGRRINSLSQGGKPVDVAEAIAFFAQPRSAGLTGQVLRVCGQSMLGA